MTAHGIPREPLWEAQNSLAPGETWEFKPRWYKVQLGGWHGSMEMSRSPPCLMVNAWRLLNSDHCLTTLAADSWCRWEMGGKCRGPGPSVGAGHDFLKRNTCHVVYDKYFTAMVHMTKIINFGFAGQLDSSHWSQTETPVRTECSVTFPVELLSFNELKPLSVELLA